MKHKHTRLIICSTPIVLVSLLLACGIGPSTVKGDIPTLSQSPTLTSSAAQPSAAIETTTSLPPAPSPDGAGTAVQSPSAVTYYVRPDGGSPDQCTGQADAAYPGSGTNQPCAWDHPFRALPPGGTPRIAGGDTLIIASGSYMMGYGAPGADDCEADGAFDCHMPPLPSGPDAAQPTRVLGAGWDSGCNNPPELWGTQRPWFILNLADASHVEIACFEITDHSSCVDSHSGGLACQRDTYPFGEWADTGLYAEDSTDVHLQDLDIHGLAYGGVHAGRLTDWTVENVRVAGNGWVGWDGDIDGDDSNAGTLTFRHWTVEWNGCGETYPGGEPTGCWGQSAGGYGDGVGTGATGGHWIIEDSAFTHNTSDGLDLLYAREEGSSIEIRRTIAEGNAGDQIKTSGPTVVENVIAVSNCGFFQGKSFTYNVDNCRSGGSAIALTLRDGNTASVTNSTLTGQGDCLMITECQDGYSCSGSESVLLRNDIFQGHPEFEGEGDTTCFTWHGLSHEPFATDHAIINGLKNIPEPCPADSLCSVSPGLADGDIDNFDAHLSPSSSAIDNGTADGAPSHDFDGHARDATPDIGAYEYGGTPSTVQAEFSATPLSGQPPLTVTFTNLSTGTYTDRLWDFGDGMSNALENPIHTYVSTGTYTVTLTVSGTAGSDTETKPGYINVQQGATFYVHLPILLKGHAPSTLAKDDHPIYASTLDVTTLVLVAVVADGPGRDDNDRAAVGLD